MRIFYSSMLPNYVPRWQANTTNSPLYFRGTQTKAETAWPLETRLVFKINRWLPVSVKTAWIKSLGKEKLEEKKARDSVSHELGHAFINFLAGDHNQALMLFTASKHNVGAMVIPSKSPQTHDDYMYHLVTLLSGYTFHLGAENLKPPSERRSTNHFLIRASSDINAIRQMLWEARKAGMLPLEQSLDLSRIPIENLLAKTKASEEDQRKAIKALQQTLRYPYVKEAFDTSAQLMRYIEPEQILKMIDRCVEKRELKGKELVRLFEDTFSEKQIHRLQFILEGMGENFDPPYNRQAI